MKKWYRSKTIWANLIAASVLIVQFQYGFVVSPEAQLGLLALINLFLRALTKEGLVEEKEEKKDERTV